MVSAAAVPGVSVRESARETALTNFEIAARKLGLDEYMRAILLTPMRQTAVEIPLQMDDETIRVFKGARVQHNGVRGPAMGGLRFSPSADLELMSALAEITTWKNAVLAIPFGGAHGGVLCDPMELSQTERERLTRQFISRVHVMLGPYRDVIMPDRNTDAQIMEWAFDEYCSIHGFTAGCVTGKPADLGGYPASEQAVGRGIAVIFRQIASGLGFSLRGLRIAIHGFNRTGAQAAAVLDAMGGRIIAVSDVHSAIRSRFGLDLKEFEQHVQEHGSVTGFPGTDALCPSELLECGCDVLVLASDDTTLTACNASRVRAKCVVEGVDLAITPAADCILEGRGVTIIPDLLANTGGVTASYLEWAQNLQRVFWEEDYSNRQLEIFLDRACQAVVQRAKRNRLSLRIAAYSLGIERVARCERLRAA
jgi:glutamate dehydrogenase (NAD(P)+)